MLQRKQCADRTEWLNQRIHSIGASEVAAVVGMSPWMTVTDLWQLKTGRVQPKNLSDNDSVSLGVSLEPVLRDMYKVLRPDYAVDYHQFDILYDDERPFMTCTLDGEIVTAEGRKGVLEIKTATLRSNASYREWQDRIPDHYLCQCTAQLACTGWDFVDLFAGLIDAYTGEITIRTYHMERSEMLVDIQWVITNTAAFWERVQKQEIPPVKLSL